MRDRTPPANLAMTLGIFAVATVINPGSEDITAQQQAAEQQKAQKQEAKHQQIAVKHFQPTHEQCHKPTHKHRNTGQCFKRY